MAGSDEINSHPVENNDNARINLTGAELKALVDDAVTKALERQYEEYSGTRSRTLSTPHSKPPSKKDEPKKEDDERHSSNHHSDPSQQIILNQGPRDKGCSYKYFVSCKPRDFTGEEGAVDCMTWLDEMDTVVDISGCAERDVVKFVSQSFKGEALAWWRSLIQATGKIPLYNMTWDQFVALIKENYCPQHEVEKIETEFLTLVMENLDCQAYLTSFNTKSRLVPYLITPEPKRIARFIGGLAPEIKASVKASRPTTFRSAADLSLSLTLDVVRNKAAKASEEGKRKREEDNSQNPKKSKSELNNNQQDSNKKPTCKTCNRRHWGQCRSNQKIKQCGICKRTGHQSHECRDIKNANCFSCGEKGHISTNCPEAAKEGAAKSGMDKKGNA